MSKGKSYSGGKGSSQGSYPKLDPNQCAYCHNFGHPKADCRKMQHDKAAGGVRQVHEDGDADQAGKNVNRGASSSNAAPPSNVQNIRAVSKVGPHVPYVQDLTDFEQYPFVDESLHSSVCVFQQHGMTSTDNDDDDDKWSFSPFLSTECDLQHVRAIPLNSDGGRVVEVLLDSGAGSSVLPLDCANLDHAVAVDTASRFVDAQGAQIQLRGRRVAEVCLGNDVIIKEQFMVETVTGPIICLGRLLRSGWDISRINGELRLCKDGYSFATYYRKNSLYTQGVISKISNMNEVAEESGAQAINAIRLTS